MGTFSFNTPLWELFGWYGRLQLWTTGDWQLHHNNTHSCIMSYADFFGETVNHPRGSAPLQPRFGSLRFLAFSKTKITFERKRFSTFMRFRKIQCDSSWWLGEGWEVPRCLLWRGLKCHCPMYNVSCILYVPHKCLYFSYYMAGYLLDRAYISKHKL